MQLNTDFSQLSGLFLLEYNRQTGKELGESFDKIFDILLDSEGKEAKEMERVMGREMLKMSMSSVMPMITYSALVTLNPSLMDKGLEKVLVEAKENKVSNVDLLNSVFAMVTGDLYTPESSKKKEEKSPKKVALGKA